MSWGMTLLVPSIGVCAIGAVEMAREAALAGRGWRRRRLLAGSIGLTGAAAAGILLALAMVG